MVTSSRRLALIVGVNGQSVPDRAALECAVNDGRDMAQVLQQDCCGFELFSPPLLDEQATTSQVRDAVLDLADCLQDDDFGLFFFSGHAEAIPVGADLDEVYLVTYDFNSTRAKRDKEAYLSLRWLRQMLFEHDKARSILIILDCCYAGKFSDSAPDQYLNELQQRLRYYFAEPGAQSPSCPGGVRLALTATGDGPAKEENGHGLLTGRFLAVLKNEREQVVDERGQVTFTDLFGYLSRHMPPGQRPHFFGAGGELILATYPDLSIEKRRERQQAAQLAEREQRLRSMVADHRGFLQDRLESFVGREQELAEVRQHIELLLSTGGYLTITGHAGQGKSSIIAKLVEDIAREQSSLERVAYHFIPLTPPPDYQVALLRNLMARLILKYKLSDLYLASENRAALSEAFPIVLREIAEKGGREVIFVDGLDQLVPDQQTGLRDLNFLPQGSGNPPQNIVFVLGTRPDDTLRPLELLKPYYEYKLPNLSRADFDQILQHRGVKLERTLVNKFYGTLEKNALYLDLVAKELAARYDISDQEVGMIVQQIADNPENLFSLTVDRLRWQETLWTDVIKPVLGLLLATNEPLIREHLKHLLNLDATRKVDGEQLNRGLERLGGLIVIDDRQRYSLFHLKFREYLRQNTQLPNKKYVFDAEDEKQWEKCFISWCEQDGIAQIWDDAVSDAIEHGRRCYARLHYVTHLYRAGDWSKLFGVLDESLYGKAKIKYDPSTRAYAIDLDLGRLAAASPHWHQREISGLLPRLWQYTLLRCTLTTWVDSYPVATFRLMLLLGQEAKALGLAELLTKPYHKARVFLLIAENMMKLAGRELETSQLLLRTEQAIYSIIEKKNQIEALVALGRELTRIQRWKDAERVIRSLPYESHKVEALIGLERTLIQAERWQDAERMIRALPYRKREVSELIHLGVALAQAQQSQEARRIWRETEQAIKSLSDEESKIELLTHLGVALAQAQQSQKARRIWQKTERMIHSLSNKRSKVESLTYFGVALAQAQQWQESERVIHSLPLTKHKAQALIALGKAFAQAQQWQETERICQQAEWVIDSLSDEESRDHALAELGGAFAQAQQWQETDRVIRSISDEESKNRALTYFAAALTQAERWQGAEQVIYSLYNEESEIKAMGELRRALIQAQQWKEAERVIRSIPDKWRKIEALTELGEALVQAQRWQEARRIWQETERVIYTLSREESKVEVLANLGIALAQAQERQEAERIWQQTEQVIHTPYKEKNRTEALAALGIALLQVQKWQEAEQAIHSIPDEETKAEALTMLGMRLLQSQQLQEAERVIRSIRHDESRAAALTALGMRLLQSQQLQEAERVIRFIRDDESRATVLMELGIGLIQAQQWQQAELVIRSIRDEENRAESLTALGKALIQVQQLQQAERMIHSIRNEGYRVEGLMALIKALNQAQKWQEAERVIRSIRDEENRIKALSTLGKALAQAQQWEAADRIIRSLPDGECKAETLTALGKASALAQRRRLAKQNLQHADQIWQDKERAISFLPIETKVEALIKLGESLARSQRLQDARRIWQAAEQEIHSIHSFYNAETKKTKAEALIALGIALHQAQQWQEAIQIWQTAEQEIKSAVYFFDAKTEADTLTALGKALIQAQQWQKAERVIYSIRNEEYRDEGLAALGKALIQTKQWQEGERVIRSIRNRENKIKVLMTLWKSLAQAQQWQDADRIILSIRNERQNVKTLVTPTSWSEHSQAEDIIQQKWLHVADRDESLASFHLVCGLILHNPQLGVELHNAFVWVDNFLHG